jgi:hypothetical protein
MSIASLPRLMRQPKFLKLSRLWFFLLMDPNLLDLKGELSPEPNAKVENPDHQIHLLI